MTDPYAGKFCETCGRRLGVACQCGQTFRERMAGVQINEASLKYGPRRGKRRRTKPRREI